MAGVDQRINALDHYPLEEVKTRPRAAAHPAPREGEDGGGLRAPLSQPSHRKPPVAGE